MKYIIGGLAIIAAIGTVVWTSTKTDSMVAYYKVSEALAAPEKLRENSRISGYVEKGSIEKVSLNEVRFLMYEGEGKIPVYYKGTIPDTFKDESEVVVEGSLKSGEPFQAHTLLAKCPSKYEAEDPELAPHDLSGATKGKDK